MLLLIAQEAISNALRHAKPTVFNVSVRATTSSTPTMHQRISSCISLSIGRD
jgi:nitrate/nitrite-specific signal transduction histidine kinase